MKKVLVTGAEGQLGSYIVNQLNSDYLVLPSSKSGLNSVKIDVTNLNNVEDSMDKFNPDIIKAVAKDMNIKTGVVDPLGATLKPGKNLYFDLIRNMSASFKGC